MLTINTNLSSLIAQSSMKSSTNKLNQAIERMTTGFKINHAKDNAANYAISTNMTTKINTYMIAEDNVLQSLDMINTASESLNLIEDKLTRIRALATQANNGTYGIKSKEAINVEANALVEEINRLYNNTEYNGIKLFAEEEIIITPDESMRVVNQTSFIAGETYYLTTSEDLVKLQDLTNSGVDTTGVNFELVEDIDMTGIAFRGIGISDSIYFNGNFNGNGHTISNLKISTTENFAGLFGRSKGNIENVHLTNCDISGAISIGGLVGYTEGTIKSCSVTGTVKGSINVGGIAGRLDNVAENCHSNTDVQGEKHIGGIAGTMQGGGIKHSYSSGNTTATTKSVGGIVGSANSGAAIESCYSDGTISGGEQAGGIAGYTSGGPISYSYSKAIISGTRWIGGIVGYTDGTPITSCYSLSNLSGTSNIGQIIGLQNGGSVNDCASLDTMTESEIITKYTHDYMQMTVENGWDLQGTKPILNSIITDKQLPENIEIITLTPIYLSLGSGAIDSNRLFFDKNFYIADLED